MNILLLEPYYGGSHKQWADALKQYSAYHIDILGLPPRHWKWRMHGAAVTMAEEFNRSKQKPDLILCSDMLDLSVFLALTRRETARTASIAYFHENQITYPKSDKDTDIARNRDNHYAYINYVTAISADKNIFNSQFHLDDFYHAAKKMLEAFPDHRNLGSLNDVRKKSGVIPVGIDSSGYNQINNANEIAHILWNHRWEDDKNPTEFFQLMYKLKDAGKKFKLVILGKDHADSPHIFNEASKTLDEEIVKMGYCESRSEYLHWLAKCDFIPITSNQEYFGVSVLEAIRLGVYPIMPNRLSYPEHVPVAQRKKHLYLTIDDLYSRLELLLDQYSGGIRPLVDFTVEKYDWENVIKEYDQFFKETLRKKVISDSI